MSCDDDVSIFWLCAVMWCTWRQRDYLRDEGTRMGGEDESSGWSRQLPLSHDLWLWIISPHASVRFDGMADSQCDDVM